MTTQIVWTALPNGVDASYYYFSVFVSHRLSGGPGGTLADYPLGPASDPTNWAASMLAGVTMSVSFAGAGAVPAELVPPGNAGFVAPLAPSIWSLIFPSATPVEDFATKVLPNSPSSRAIRTYSASALVGQYEALYQSLATGSGGDYPSVSTPPVADFVTALGGFPGLLQHLEQRYPGGTPPHGGVSTAGAPALQTDIETFYGGPGPVAQIAYQHYLAYRFYRRSTASQYGARSAASVAPLPVPGLTFHKLVGMLADHPTLLRNLGLVLDYRTPVVSAAGAPPPSAGTIHVNARWSGAGAALNVYPDTLYQITSDGFYAAPSLATSDLSNGVLSLSPNDSYSVVQMDADGHAQKMIAYGISAAEWTFTSKGMTKPGAASGTQSLPARRTGGLTVLKSGRADALTALFGKGDTNNANLAASNPIVLDSSDVNRGFRIDVWDTSGTATAAGGPWRSLCQRGGADVVGGTSFPLAPADAEGFVKAAGATRGGPDADASEQNTLYVHEAIFGWDGWSLCARRPGRAIAYTEGDGNQNPAVVGFLANHAPAGYPVVSNYAATPGTLPRLRFGRTYRFRARAVDLAGNGRPLGYQAAAVDPATASPAVTYLRYEPVAAPALVLQRTLTPGESLEALVIRSNPDPVDDLTKIAPGANATAYAATSAAQAAGFLDHCDRHVAPPKTSQIMAETHGMLDGLPAAEAFRVSARESGTFFHPTVFNVDTGTSDPLPGGELSFVPEPGPTPGDPPAAGQYVLHTLPTLTLPYLPDPLADGMALRFPGAPLPALAPPLGQATTLSYAVASAGWPRVTPARLTLEESSTPSIGYTASAGALAVGLPPASLVVTRLSSSPTPALLPSTTVGSSLAGLATATAAALAGANWLLSPYREVTLVHAVQRPLLIPSFDSLVPLGVGRDVGWTYVIPSGQVKVDGRSTVQVDLNAAWTDPVDDPANPAGPQKVDHTGRAFSLAVDYAATSLAINPVLAAAGPVNRHELGDTKHRWVTYSPDATTRYREYFPAAVANDPAQITTKGVVAVVNVLASRRPDPPVVLYAVPTFKWDTSPDGTTVTRTGRGIRVYFDRPWYGSGGDELVGVLLAPGGSDPAVAKYTSEWGRDPVWSSSGMAEPLAAAHFTNALTTAPQPSSVATSPAPLSAGPFALAEDSTLAANVVGFSPEYSATRNLWFVDIEMDPGDSYFPFVRLALARYQPHAIGASTSSSQHLSRVVRTEFLQLVPDRTCAVSYGPNLTLSVTVSGVTAHNTYAESVGLSPKASPSPGALVSLNLGHVPTSQVTDSGAGGGHRVTAQLQVRPAGSSNDLLWASPGDEVELAPYAETGYVLWAGTLTLPQAPAFSMNEYRLLVRERERHETDLDTSIGVTAGTPYGERLVYAAAVALHW
jgi:hypothetical protein